MYQYKDTLKLFLHESVKFFSENYAYKKALIAIC